MYIDLEHLHSNSYLELSKYLQGKYNLIFLKKIGGLRDILQINEISNPYIICIEHVKIFIP